MTTFLEFFADFAVSGTVVGVGLGSRPADWSAALDTGVPASGASNQLCHESGAASASDQVAGAADEQKRTADAGHGPGGGTGHG
jgi:hypothetical protein